MVNQTAKNITLPKFVFGGKDGVVILPLRKWERLEKEKSELRLAVEAILAGELALRKGETRIFREFLKSKFPQYAKNL